MKRFLIITTVAVTGLLVFAAWPSYSKVRRATPFTDVGNYIHYISSLVEQERLESHKLPQSFQEARTLAEKQPQDGQELLERFERKYGTAFVSFVTREDRFWLWSKSALAAESPPYLRYAWYDSAIGFRWGEDLPQDIRSITEANQRLQGTPASTPSSSTEPEARRP